MTESQSILAGKHILAVDDEADILESIEEIYLGYYDPSRKLNEQLIRSVWVVKAGDSRYIFNALTGNLVEIQTIE